jgi:hypothetical protein
VELQALQDGVVFLSAPRVDSDGLPTDPVLDPSIDDPYARIPTAMNIDKYSATAAFEEHVHQGSDATWTPRDGSRYGPVYWPRGQ